MSVFLFNRSLIEKQQEQQQEQQQQLKAVFN